MDIQTLIKVNYVGVLDQTSAYSTIGFQTVAVLVGGILLWRVSNALHKRKLQQRANQPAFRTRFSDHWKNR